MPTYEYACRACSEHLEVVQSFRDEPLTECPACGGQLRKVFQPVGIAFKGSGFYKNDSKSGSGSTSGDSSSGGEKSQSADKGSGSDKSSGSDKASGSSAEKTSSSAKPSDSSSSGSSSEKSSSPAAS